MRAKQKCFLASFAELGVVTSACQQAGYTRTAHYRSLRECEDYAQAFEEANERYTDWLEEQARQHVERGSERILLRLLEARKPDRYSRIRAVIQYSTSGSLPDPSRQAVENYLAGLAGRLNAVADGQRDAL